MRWAEGRAGGRGVTRTAYGPRVLSFGGGVQTTALAVLVAKGELACERIIFADTGGEHPATYAHLQEFQAWLIDRGCPIERVAAPVGPLADYIRARSTPIPVRVGDNEGIGHRQCTRQWKITPLTKAAGRPCTMILGISYDEVQRMKPSPDKGVTREWPLIDMRLTREDCRRIIADASLPEAPKSACFFCPLLPVAHYRRMASEEPDLFAQCVALENVINERRSAKGQRPAYLSATCRPLAELGAGQLSMFASQEAEECEGVCFV